MGLIKKILKIAVASKMADDYGVFPAAMYLANSKPDADDEICEITLKMLNFYCFFTSFNTIIT